MEKVALEAKIAESEAVKSMIITYNHQINNPLTVALGFLSLMNRPDGVTAGNIAKTKEALDRINIAVQKIGAIGKVEPLETEEYLKGSKMVKIA